MTSHIDDPSGADGDKSSIEKNEYSESTRPAPGRRHSEVDKIDLADNVTARYAQPFSALDVIRTRTHCPPTHRIKNPLLGIPRPQLMADVEAFAEEKGMTDIIDLLKRGALVAQDPSTFETVEGLTPDERTALEEEVTHKWRHPLALYVTIITCSIGAAVQ